MTATALGDNLLISMKGTSYGLTGFRLIVQYTKTNDSQMSISDGNEYSTDEQIVGHWIDGKPIYQKTFKYKTDGSSLVPTGINNLGVIIGWECSFGQPNNDNSWWTFVNEQNSYGNGYVAYDAPNNTIGVVFKDTAWGANRTVIVTIKYTKTTD